MSNPRFRKKRLLRALKEAPSDGRVFTDLFAVLQKSLSMSSRNQPYLRLTLADHSDTIDAFVWDDAEEYSRQFGEGDIIYASFRLRVRNDVPQMHIESLEPLSEKDLEGINWQDFRPGLDSPTRKRIWTEIEAILDRVTSPPLVALLQRFTSDASFCRAFIDSAAATGFHHAYVGGLAEHTLAVLRLAEAVAELYRDRLNRDLLLTGAFLHDVGKAEELSVQTGQYTDHGRLVGHIVLGVQLLREKVDQVPGFPQTLRYQLEHLVLSHHGQKEWGSPVEPQTLEAIALNFLDNLDAKLTGALQWLEKEQVREGHWSGFWRGLGRSLFRTVPPAADRLQRLANPSMEEIEDGFLRAERREAKGDTEAGEQRATSDGRSADNGPKKSPPEQGDLGF